MACWQELHKDAKILRGIGLCIGMAMLWILLELLRPQMGQAACSGANHELMFSFILNISYQT
ncbi:hypothetical protein KCTCHS21_55550 [Cohnella abietis]|uniref:Uncharacterized protein n=1 Tax=Cohnella abietis TaxID=2507935 RepID=A0A3T1DDC8_9BACL|nr:hypothetical protein KCTCHS21_55550 [Cohnella abietis]